MQVCVKAMHMILRSRKKHRITAEDNWFINEVSMRSDYFAFLFYYCPGRIKLTYRP